MKRYLVSLGSLLIIAVLTAESRAGYRDLVAEMENYLLPPVVSSQMRSSEDAPSASMTAVGDDEFQAQRDELKKQEEQWRKSLNDQTQDAHFLIPEPSLMGKLQAAANDDSEAGKALGDGFTVETLEALVLLRSPAIRGKEREFEGVLAGYTQAEHLDTILRRYSALTKSVMTGVGGMTNPDPVTLKFPFPGVLAMKGEIVGQEAAAAREALEVARRDAVTSVRKAYAELLYIQDALEILRSQLHLIKNQQQTVSTRYRAGDTDFENVLRVGIELEQIKEELISLAEEQRNMEMAIRSALSLPESIRIGSPSRSRGKGFPVVGIEALYALSLKQRQEIKIKQALVGKAERMVEMAETMIYPGFAPNRSLSEFDAVSSIGQDVAMGATEATPVTSEPGAGSTLPKTPWFGADDAYLRQAREQIKAFEADVEAERASALLGVREAWYRLDKAKRQDALYEDRITTLTQAGLDTANQAYAAGRISFSQFIDTANTWLAARLGLARARADVIIGRAELEAAVGVCSAQWEGRGALH